MKRKLVLLLFILFIISNVFAPTLLFYKTNDEILTEIENVKIKYKLSELKNAPFSLENLYNYLILLKADHREIIMKQAIHETGHFKSKLFRENNNLFGMKMPQRRETTAVGSKNNYANYNHWTKSTDDYIILQQKWKNKYDNEVFNDGYKVLILAHYAEDCNYTRQLKRIKIPNYDNTSERENSTVRS